MDPTRFDALARRLAHGTSRRQVLKGLAAALTGGLVAGAQPALLAAAAPSGNSACAQFCATTFGANTAAAKQCAADAAKGRGLCYTCGPASPGGTKTICCTKNTSGACSSYVGATCPNQQTDVNNCGACGSACPSMANATATCTSGVCGSTCNAGFSNCDQSAANGCETNLLNDAGNCGACGHVCASGETCTNGSCTCGSHADCPAGQSCCSGTCVNEQIDINNCGACGNACGGSVPNSYLICSSGQCSSTCDPGFADCNGLAADGCEVDLRSDANNCGACGHACAEGEVCFNGACSCSLYFALRCPSYLTCVDHSCVCPPENLCNGGCYTPCPSGTARSSDCTCCPACNGACVDTQTDPNNCGSCGHVCASGLTCSNGQCVCAGGMTNCSGQCVNTQTDSFNCGSCGSACIVFVDSNNNFVSYPCCNGSCSATDPSNCGSCGNQCPVPTNGSAICTNGGCGVACNAGYVELNGQCVTACPSGQTACGGTCVDLNSDPNNCGTCGHNCFCQSYLGGNSESTCRNGTCCVLPGGGCGICGEPCCGVAQCQVFDLSCP